MYLWRQQVQQMVDAMDQCIARQEDEQLTLQALAGQMGYSPCYLSRKFRQVSGLCLRDYLRRRRLAFALKEVRDSQRELLDIALAYGFASHEAFTRAFRALYGVSPSQYRKHLRPLVLRTKIIPFDRYFFGMGEIGMIQSQEGIHVYFATIPAHQFLCIRNAESNGYWDFWERQGKIPGQDCDTICGLLDSIPHKLDDLGGTEPNSGCGQIMAYLHDPAGVNSRYGVPRVECYGVRLPEDYDGPVPPPLRLVHIPEGEYVVFEHGPFDYEQENQTVGKKMEAAVQSFDFSGTGYCLDTAPGRIAYMYHDPQRFWKEVLPVTRTE